MTVYNNASPEVQRFMRRAWKHGVNTYGWVAYHDNHFYQLFESIAVSLYEEFVTLQITASGSPITILPTPPTDPPVPNDPNTGLWP